MEGAPSRQIESQSCLFLSQKLKEEVFLDDDAPNPLVRTRVAIVPSWPLIGMGLSSWNSSDVKFPSDGLNGSLASIPKMIKYPLAVLCSSLLGHEYDQPL